MSCFPKSLTVAFVLFAAMCFAQTDATVSGTVSDPSGAHVANALVTAVNTGTAVSTNAQTNEAGIFVFAALPVGVYRFTAEHPGFRKATLPDVVLAVGAKLTVNIPRARPNN